MPELSSVVDVTTMPTTAATSATARQAKMTGMIRILRCNRVGAVALKQRMLQVVGVTIESAAERALVAPKNAPEAHVAIVSTMATVRTLARHVDDSDAGTSIFAAPGKWWVPGATNLSAVRSVPQPRCAVPSMQEGHP